MDHVLTLFFKKYDKQFWLQDWKLIMCTETCLTRGTCQEGEEWTLICIMVRSGLVIQEGMRRLDEDQHLADCHPLTHHTQCHCFSSRPGPATRCRSAQCTSHQLSSRGAEALSSPTRHSLKYLFTIITVVVLPAVILNGKHSPGGVSKGVHISNPTGGSHTAGSHKVVDSERTLLQ